MKVLIVDGYNVIRSTGAYPHATKEDLDVARDALISDVAAFAQKEWRATVVFDGAGNPESQGIPSRVAGIDVIYSRAGIDADSVIESLARRAREAELQVCVVTSDAATQWTVYGGGVDRMSSAAFVAELHSSHTETAGYNPLGLSKTVLGDRLDPEVAKKLYNLARGIK